LDFRQSSAIATAVLNAIGKQSVEIAGDSDLNVNLADADHDELRAIVNQEMSFGRFKGRKLINLPEPYVAWFKNAGFPRGLLGQG
jgi:hypothetical protein